MQSASAKATIRVIVGSFVAGAGAMALVGLVGPVAMQGGLSVRDAFAAQMESGAPAVEPLDIPAIQAQLADADRAMEAMREATADNLARLDTLAGR
jgi:hypothetical protein